MQNWDPEQDDTLICVAVRDETHDVRSFVFAAEPARRFDFAAGQFLTFAFVVDGVETPRCYTIASPPSRPDRAAITVKRVTGGAVSPWLHATMRPGARVRVEGPMGDFCPLAVPGKRLLVSGGSGITPMMSAARTAHDRGSLGDLVFVHAARSPADIIFRAELAGMGMRHAVICETDSPGEAWPGFRGRLSLAALLLMAPDLLDRAVFCCGPAPFMAAVRAMLDEAGFDRGAYHEESFDFAQLAADEPGVAADIVAAEAKTERVFSVRFSKSGQTVACPAGVTVLDAARAAGLRLPSSCTRGMCGTCKTKVAGRVEMHHQGGIRQREIDAGLALLCCSRPLEDLVVER